MRTDQICNHLPLTLVLGEVRPGLVYRRGVDGFDGLGDPVRLVNDLRLEQIENGHGFVRTELLTTSSCALGHLLATSLKIAREHTIIFCLELGDQMRLYVLYLPNFNRCHRLIELGLDVAQAVRSADLLVLLKEVLEISANSFFNIR